MNEEVVVGDEGAGGVGVSVAVFCRDSQYAQVVVDVNELEVSGGGEGVEDVVHDSI